VLDSFIDVSASYNRYLAIAARVVRRSLKEDKRLAAERRGEMDLRFAKWEVSLYKNHSDQGGHQTDMTGNAEWKARRDEERRTGTGVSARCISLEGSRRGWNRNWKRGR